MVHGDYRSPQKLLDELGITEPEDIRLKAIALHCGALIIEEPLSGCEACLMGVKDRAIITVNSGSIPVRQRFSAAHELGHWLRGKGKVASNRCQEDMLNIWRERDRVDDNEASANRFASELLLPDSMFRPRAKNRPITLGTVRDLASTFQTSLTATAIRLVEEGSMPGMVICTGPSGRLWFVMGSDVPRKLFPLQRPGAGSVAYDLLNGRAEASENVSVDADNWIDHPDAGEYEVIENSILITRNTVLTLLWWKDEKQILDLDRDGD